mmetsp:Transcript_19678/g.25933  ORF Transcript_19678/g.25933 Transcript_19678/m.25933 type:complete len:326 (+) Transcript_19678:172-1149(+)
MGDLIKSEYLLKADILVERAEELLDSNVVFETKPRYEGACELYSLAADYFKIAGKLVDAGNCLTLCAKLQGKLGQRPEMAAYHAEAARVYKIFDPKEAIKFYRMAIGDFLELKNFGVGGRLQEEVADIYFNDRNYDMAAGQYKNAALLYSEQRDHAAANQTLLKAAELFTLLRQYSIASECFEEVGFRDLKQNCLKFNAIEHFLNACLCLLAEQDFDILSERVEIMCQKDASWQRSREHLFIKNIVQIILERDIDAFADHVYNFDNVHKLNSMQIRLLGEVRSVIEQLIKEQEEEEQANAESVEEESNRNSDSENEDPEKEGPVT